MHLVFWYTCWVCLGRGGSKVSKDPVVPNLHYMSMFYLFLNVSFMVFYISGNTLLNANHYFFNHQPSQKISIVTVTNLYCSVKHWIAFDMILSFEIPFILFTCLSKNRYSRKLDPDHVYFICFHRCAPSLLVN